MIRLKPPFQSQVITLNVLPSDLVSIMAHLDIKSFDELNNFELYINGKFKDFKSKHITYKEGDLLEFIKLAPTPG